MNELISKGKMKRERQQAASITFIKSKTIKHAKERCEYTFFMDTEFEERLTHGCRNNRGSVFYPTRHPTLSHRSLRNSVLSLRPLSTPSICNTRVSISFESASDRSTIRCVHCNATKQQKSAKHKRGKNSPVFSGPFSKKMVEGRLTIRFDKKEFVANYNESNKIGWLRQYLSVVLLSKIDM